MDFGNIVSNASGAVGSAVKPLEGGAPAKAVGQVTSNVVGGITNAGKTLLPSSGSPPVTFVGVGTEQPLKPFSSGSLLPPKINPPNLKPPSSGSLLPPKANLPWEIGKFPFRLPPPTMPDPSPHITNQGVNSTRKTVGNGLAQAGYILGQILFGSRTGPRAGNPDGRVDPSDGVNFGDGDDGQEGDGNVDVNGNSEQGPHAARRGRYPTERRTRGWPSRVGSAHDAPG